MKWSSRTLVMAPLVIMAAKQWAWRQVATTSRYCRWFMASCARNAWFLPDCCVVIGVVIVLIIVVAVCARMPPGFVMKRSIQRGEVIAACRKALCQRKLSAAKAKYNSPFRYRRGEEVFGANINQSETRHRGTLNCGKFVCVWCQMAKCAGGDGAQCHQTNTGLFRTPTTIVIPKTSQPSFAVDILDAHFIHSI